MPRSADSPTSRRTGYSVHRHQLDMGKAHIGEHRGRARRQSSAIAQVAIAVLDRLGAATSRDAPRRSRSARRGHCAAQRCPKPCSRHAHTWLRWIGHDARRGAGRRSARIRRGDRPSTAATAPSGTEDLGLVKVPRPRDRAQRAPRGRRPGARPHRRSACPSHALNSPMTLTRRALGAHSVKAMPAAPLTVPDRLCAPSTRVAGGMVAPPPADGRRARRGPAERNRYRRTRWCRSRSRCGGDSGSAAGQRSRRRTSRIHARAAAFGGDRGPVSLSSTKICRTPAAGSRAPAIRPRRSAACRDSRRDRHGALR